MTGAVFRGNADQAQRRSTGKKDDGWTIDSLNEGSR